MKDFRLGAWVQPYVEFASPKEVRECVQRAAEAGMSALFPCVKSETHFTDGRSLAYYNTQRIERGTDWDVLRCLCDEGARAGVEIHAWVCTFLEGKSKLLEERPELESMRFDHLHEQVPTGMACPAREEVRCAEIEVIKEIAGGYPVAGIHLDFIRYAELRACSCSHCRKELYDETGLRPEDIDTNGRARRAWLEMRMRAVSEFVQEAADVVKASGKMLSAAVFADYPAIADIAGQDWLRWLQEGWLDFAVAMSYTKSEEEFLRRAALHKALSRGSLKIMEGIAKRTEKVCLSPEELRTQVELAEGMGAAGAVFFSMGALGEADLNVVREKQRSNQ